MKHLGSLRQATLQGLQDPVKFTEVLDRAAGPAVGTILTRTAAGWVVLPPGSEGQVLTAHGPGQPLTWETP